MAVEAIVLASKLKIGSRESSLLAVRITTIIESSKRMRIASVLPRAEVSVGAVKVKADSSGVAMDQTIKSALEASPDLSVVANITKANPAGQLAEVREAVSAALAVVAAPEAAAVAVFTSTPLVQTPLSRTSPTTSRCPKKSCVSHKLRTRVSS